MCYDLSEIKPAKMNLLTDNPKRLVYIVHQIKVEKASKRKEIRDPMQLKIIPSH